MQKLKAQLDEAGIDTSTLRSLADDLKLPNEKYGADSTAYQDLSSIFMLAPSRKVHELGLWMQIRKLVAQTGYYPVIVEAYNYSLPHSYVSIQTILDNASQIDGKQWLDEQWQEYLDACAEEDVNPDDDIDQPGPMSEDFPLTTILSWMVI